MSMCACECMPARSSMSVHVRDPYLRVVSQLEPHGKLKALRVKLLVLVQEEAVKREVLPVVGRHLDGRVVAELAHSVLHLFVVDGSVVVNVPQAE